jgi:SAM-dependent methyltransferase
MHSISLARDEMLVAVDVDPAEYRRINLANWNSRVPHHEMGYRLHEHRNDPNHLSQVVRFDLPRLGDIAGSKGVHLQCHIGTDTVSLARLGAHMTGLDFSAPPLAVAAQLAVDCGQDISYVESDVYEAVEVLGAAQFDFVYTGIGALCWLPSVARWAEVVAGLLRPGGFLFIREGHPMLWTLCDPREDQLVVIDFPYFETGGTVFVEESTYVEHESALTEPTIVHFNHSLSEIFNALWRVGLTITMFEEHRSVPWNALGDAMVEDATGEWQLRDMPERLAASYTLRAEKQ